jgi:hypothetical protein
MAGEFSTLILQAAIWKTSRTEIAALHLQTLYVQALFLSQKKNTIPFVASFPETKDNSISRSRSSWLILDPIMSLGKRKQVEVKVRLCTPAPV